MPIDVLCEHKPWLTLFSGANSQALEALCANCFEAVARHEQACDGEVALLLTDDPHIRQLNCDFRNIDKPTNVLSFPGDHSIGQLGDIALGYETCLREAREKNIPLPQHIAHLIVHGLLHLTNYDHINHDDAQEMEALEVKILATMNIDNPYKDEEIA